MPFDTDSGEPKAPEYRIWVDAFGVTDTWVMVLVPPPHCGNCTRAALEAWLPETVHAPALRFTVTGA